MSRFTAAVSQTESDIRDCIFEYLLRRGHMAFRDKQPRGKPGTYKGSNFPESTGVSDILGLTKRFSDQPSVFFAIEVKKPGEKTSKEQDKFLAEVEKRGGIAMIARSLDDVRTKGL